MSNEIIHRVAKAICLCEFGNADDFGESRCCQIGGTEGCCVESIYPQAEAAIEAMREPTEAMCFMIGRHFDMSTESAEHYGRLLQCKLVDAALKDNRSE